MNLKRIILNNFKCFKNKHSFSFTKINLIDGANGSGKCININSYISTEKGLMPLKEFLPKETVYGILTSNTFYDIKKIKIFNKNLNLEQPFKVYYQGNAQTLKIKIAGGFEIEGTPNHKILLFDGENIYFETLENLFDKYQKINKHSKGFLKYQVLIPHSYGKYNNNYYKLSKDNIWNIFAINKDIVFPKYLEEDLGYFIGLYLSEGNASSNYININNTDEQIIKWLVKFCKKYKLNYSTQLNTFKISNKNFVQFLKTNELIETECLCYNKKIPLPILLSPKSVIVSTIAGIIDGDGYIDKNGNFALSLTNEPIVKFIHLFLIENGIFAVYRKKKKHGKMRYTVYVNRHNTIKMKEIGLIRLKRKYKRCSTIASSKNKKYRYYESIYLTKKIKDKIREKLRGQINLNKYLYYKNYTGRISLENIKTLKKYLNDKDFNFLNFVDNYYFLPIIKIEKSICEVADFVMPQTKSFIANGIVNHNTTLGLDSILFALYGYSDKALNSLVTKGEKSCEVKVEFDDYTITRKYPTKIIVEPNIKFANNIQTQNWINNRYGTLDYFKKFRLLDVTKGINILEEGNVSLQKTLFSIYEDFFNKIRQNLLEEKRKREVYNKDKTVVYKHFPSQKRLDLLKVNILKIAEEIYNLEKEIKRANDDFIEITNKKAKKEHNKEFYNTQKNKIISSSYCPTCKRKLNLNIKQNLLKEINNNIMSLNDSIQKLNSEIEEQKDLLNYLKNLKESLYNKKLKINELILKLESRIKQKEFIYSEKDVLLYKKAIEELDLFCNNFIIDWLKNFEPIINNIISKINFKVEFNFNKKLDLHLIKDNQTYSYKELSTGQKLILSIAFKLAILLEKNETGLIIADEGFSSLDYENLNYIVELFKGLPFQLVMMLHRYEDIPEEVNVIKLGG